MLARRLRAAGHDVISVSRREGPDTIVADLADDDLASKLPNVSFDALIHFAATVPSNEASSTWTDVAPATVHGTIELLKWAEGRIGRVLLGSSCAVYGESKQYVPTDENHPLTPDTPYALAKYAQEQLLQAFCRSRGIPLAVMRLGYVYGPGVPAFRSVVSFVDRVKSGETITLYKPGRGLHLIHTDDIASIGDVLLREGHGVYNVVSNRHITMREYIETAAQVLGREAHIVESGTHEPSNWYSSTRLRQLHRLEPRVNLADGIRSLCPSE
jgi:UDP-glucose 4-epimerase